MGLHRLAALAAVATLIVCPAALIVSPDALASSEAECTAAVQKAEADASNMPDMEDPSSRRDHFETMLAQASEAGIQGDYDRCLELVRDARGGSGLSPE